MSTTKDIGSSISEQRKKRGITQRQLADQLFVSASAVSKWENGDAIPDIHVVTQLADIFHISVSELLGVEDKSSEKEVDNIPEEKTVQVADGIMIIEEQTEQSVEAEIEGQAEMESEPEEQNELELQPVSTEKKQRKH